MASIIWDRDPQEAIKNPYEYNAQKQFHREAIALTDKLGKKLDDFHYTLADKTIEKAIWMLQTDALFAFRDAVIMLDQKRHRIVGRLLRDILETVHLVEYFSSQTDKSKKALQKWFDDELVMHSEFRDYIKKRDGETISEIKKIQHRIFSKFTHRSYKILLYGYALGSNDRIFYDNGWTLSQSVAMYYAFLGSFGQLVVKNLKEYGGIPKEVVSELWNSSMEKEQIPRGYLSKEDKEFLGIDD
ncbi:MAG: hypothetical protein M9933_03090 [Chitinophagaceae bacterium]|nr:hypothetical protein [Chitinophagaceae bacterium]